MKKILHLTFGSVLFLFYANSYAQFNPVWNKDYQHTTSGFFSNEGRKVVVDNSGNVFSLSDVTSDLDPSGVVTGLTYYYVVLTKYLSGSSVTAAEEVINVQNHFNSGFDFRSAFGLELDASGNVFCAYSTCDAGNCSDIKISKYDNGLNPVWTYTFNAASIDSGIDFKVSPSGVAYAIVKSTATSGIVRYRALKASGSLSTSTPLYSFSQFPDYVNSLALNSSQSLCVTGYRVVAGSKVLMTAMISNTGILIWQNIFDGGSAAFDDIGKHITVGIDGFVYVTGTSDRSSTNGIDVVTLRFDPVNGKIKWFLYQNYNTTDGGVFIAAPDLNNVFVGSVSSNTIVIDQIQISNNGGGGGAGGVGAGTLISRLVYNPVPAAPYWTLNGALLTDMKLSANKRIYLTGNIKAFDNSAQPFNAAWLAKADFISRGTPTIQFATSVDGDFGQSLFSASIAVSDANHQVVWMRNTSEDFNTHNFEHILINGYAVPLPVRYGVDGLNQNASNILLTPNPAANFISIASSEKMAKIELIDLSGKTIKSVQVNSANVVIDLSQLEQGIYIGIITDATGNVYFRKIIKSAE
ncbi:MAG: T9SS type A sorting domain-containing protein [Bacteroidia bacterium]